MSLHWTELTAFHFFSFAVWMALYMALVVGLAWVLAKILGWWWNR